MTNTIRILALNDDNHYTKFYTEDKVIEGHSPVEIIHFLAQAHSINYEIRGVYICDMPEREDEYFDKCFDVVDCGTSHYTYSEAFNALWAISERHFYI